MEDKAILRELIKERGLTQEGFGRMCGYNAPAAIPTILRGTTGMRTDTLTRLLGVLGCELIVRDIDTGDEWKVGDDTPEQKELYKAKREERKKREAEAKERLENIKELERAMKMRAKEYDYSKKRRYV